MNISCQCLEVIIAFFGTQVACTQDVLNTSRNQELLELGWEGADPMRNVKITEHKDQLWKVNCYRINKTAKML